MSDIDQKRKEQLFDGDLTLKEIGLQQIAYEMGKKDGVEMARKEFLEILQRWYDSDDGSKGLNFKELKQKLGEKT